MFAYSTTHIVMSKVIHLRAFSPFFSLISVEVTTICAAKPCMQETVTKGNRKWCINFRIADTTYMYWHIECHVKGTLCSISHYA